MTTLSNANTGPAMTLPFNLNADVSAPPRPVKNPLSLIGNTPIVEIIKLYYPDPTDASGRFGMVDVRAVKPLPLFRLRGPGLVITLQHEVALGLSRDFEFVIAVGVHCLSARSLRAVGIQMVDDRLLTLAAYDDRATLQGGRDEHGRLDGLALILGRMFPAWLQLHAVPAVQLPRKIVDREGIAALLVSDPHDE